MNASGQPSDTAVRSSPAAPAAGSGVDRLAPSTGSSIRSSRAMICPARGRSLFDFLVSEEQGGELHQAVPFPFSALLQRIEARARSAPDSRGRATKAVLIPLGRSLQRNSAAPDFFAYPRVVVAVDSEPAGSGDPYLKDRLYLGYQEKADLIEVISYNEDAGRFEFQVVTGYRRGGSPRIVYANRTLCLACHQNAAPIFSRAVWDETNANPRVAALLASARNDFHGIPIDRGVDVPNAIDDATLRANRFAVNQLLWQQGCGGNDEPAVTCRAGLFAAVLQYRLSGQQHFDRADPSYRDNVAARVTTASRRQWPGGLAIGNPDLPNRNPLSGESADVGGDCRARGGKSCGRRRRIRSAVAAPAARSLARCRARRRCAAWSRASPISSPKRMWSASTPHCGSGRKAAASRAGRTAATAKSRVRRPRAAASASNSAARPRRPRPIAAWRWKADCSLPGPRCRAARSIGS